MRHHILVRWAPHGGVPIARSTDKEELMRLMNGGRNPNIEGMRQHIVDGRQLGLVPDFLWESMQSAR